ncbi:ankyrin repeat domain-containing protein 33B [Brachyhypopomus gauderio]|uniref:ankyrin repeat domain-containing protein 33B n=1 Tax=Brachyhypopomus gauderio TaxID=698409 RepID=UPI004042ECDD
MVLITDGREGGGSPGRNKPVKSLGTTSQVHPTITEDPPDIADDLDQYLGSYESEFEDCEEYNELSTWPEENSVISDDSFYPPDSDFVQSDRTACPDSPDTLSLFRACCDNNACAVRTRLRQGVTEEQVRETDKNSRTGLMVACYHGYIEVVTALSQCPHVDVNQQDNEGNTALVMAAQAGNAPVTTYLLNYFPGLDIEKRNCHGFTALMKAAMQGRVDCVRALIMAGADLQARDYGRGFTPREWALFTGRHETAFVMLRLVQLPCPEQCCDSYRPEWPLLPALVANAQRPKGCVQKLSETLRGVFNIANVTEATEDGVLDHMVRMTTALGSPAIAVACRTVCPESPPCVGKRRYAVPEILRRRRQQQVKELGPARLDNYQRLFQNSRVTLVPKRQERRASLQGPGPHNPDKALALRRPSLLPLHLARRSSVRPGLVVPKLRITRAPPTTYKPETERKKSGGGGARGGAGGGAGGEQFLQLPKWRYKELKEEKRKAEEAEKKRLEVTRKQLHTSKQK